MKIKLDGTPLTEAVSLVVKITGAKHISVKASDDTLEVSGTERGKSLMVRVPCSVQTEGQFGALPESLLGVCRSRKSLILEMNDDESQVLVTSGKYSSEIPIIPFEDISIDEPAGTEMDMEDAELKVLLDVCNRAQLTSPLFDGAQLPIHLKITDAGTHVACLDSTHVASIRTKQVTRDEELDVVMPSGALNSVAQASHGTKYRIILSEAVIYADSDSFKLVLPLEQLEGKSHGFAGVTALQNKIKKTPAEATATVEFEELSTILSNVYSVSEASVPISFKVGKNTLTVGTTTNYGSANEALDAETTGKGEFFFNTAVISEVFAKMGKGSIQINFLPAMAYISVKNGEVASMFVVMRVNQTKAASKT